MFNIVKLYILFSVYNNVSKATNMALLNDFPFVKNGPTKRKNLKLI